jgi:hypothetical protein
MSRAQGSPFFDGAAFGDGVCLRERQVMRNKAVGGPETGGQKVAAHETFAEFLRLYL